MVELTRQQMNPFVIWQFIVAQIVESNLFSSQLLFAIQG